MPAIITAHDSVQLLGFDLCSSLTLMRSLYGFCSSGQSFAASFLQIPRRRGHPCLWLYPSHCRADSGLAPVRTCAHRAHKQKANISGFGKCWLFCWLSVFLFLGQCRCDLGRLGFHVVKQHNGGTDSIANHGDAGKAPAKETLNGFRLRDNLGS